MTVFSMPMVGTMGFQHVFPTLPTGTTSLVASSNLITQNYVRLLSSNTGGAMANFGQGLFYVLDPSGTAYRRVTLGATSSSSTTHNLPRTPNGGISAVGASTPIGNTLHYSNGSTIYEYDHSTSSDTGTTYTAGVDHDCFVISSPVIYLADYDNGQDEVTVYARRWPDMRPIKSVVVSNTQSATNFRAMDITVDSSGLVLFIDYSGNVYGVDFNLETSFFVDDDGVSQSKGIAYDPALDSVFILKSYPRFYEREVTVT